MMAGARRLVKARVMTPRALSSFRDSDVIKRLRLIATMIVAISRTARDFDPATLLCNVLALHFMKAVFRIKTSIRQPFYLMAQ
jgi:hypothetical protein